MMAVPRAYLQVGWLLGTAMLLGVVSRQLLCGLVCLQISTTAVTVGTGWLAG
jgi:hypothetical protein